MAEPRLDVRRAVRNELHRIVRDGAQDREGDGRDESGRDEDGLASMPLVLVACSGGPDSLALAAALAHQASRAGVRAGGVSVDHGLQEGSADRARAVGAVLVGFGLEPVETIHVRVPAGVGGPEGRARRARYAALESAAARHGASAVLLGHTLDDQAETVLLGLARGSGPRSLAGMAERTGIYHRPLLRLTRDAVRAAVPGDVKPWEDPHNTDSAYARVRVRKRVLPVLEEELGPGISAALARTADLLRADADALDSSAGSARAAAATTAAGGAPAYDVGTLVGLSKAVRWRVLRAAAIDAGCPPTDLTAAHIEAIDMLITGWRGQKGVDLPGAIRARRRGGLLRFDALN
ncbi:tRNA lysidine(34) synthetase TilS [Actinobacteria bacterium YIM 96077]|uniref:tRNA(Ile)-lysidine synthase n=1 Tax=Phytoactinopolyspora halophila TaxID=1981511 RepID=A0A329QJQ7_9ACTN|nr:tRNA lysidine(34) synthetase TilS [Phytoactinopolyspora halophila]AYY14667.1 tRNA lysidine(34) synthetase TilS [Actinobacteria bacterium YIM 96077]RAW11622.1 tRNA lysidine(34) synthetase TilS [Phytoactinopolyspora halophila]